ncbi:unnamed protein product [Clonostachys chloroleuca]|uniref:Uncharacterized protein n=1 Tax=Clonostachys chloroleuca TaxID=1926264 RepID=A0AA35LPZ7_9HYPO|nr:unnamed protein product [Clonostachys chloroleuca]
MNIDKEAEEGNQTSLDRCSWEIALAKGRISGTKEDIEKAEHELRQSKKASPEAEASLKKKQKLESELAVYENDLKYNEEK